MNREWMSLVVMSMRHKQETFMAPLWAIIQQQAGRSRKSLREVSAKKQSLMLATKKIHTLPNASFLPMDPARMQRYQIPTRIDDSSDRSFAGVRRSQLHDRRREPKTKHKTVVSNSKVKFKARQQEN